MDKKEKDDYIILFGGAKLSRREAKKVGLGLFFGFIGATISAFSLGQDNKFAGYIICIIFIAIGYFWIGNKIFKK